jgi:hypothetical protein
VRIVLQVRPQLYPWRTSSSQFWDALRTSQGNWKLLSSFTNVASQPITTTEILDILLRLIAIGAFARNVNAVDRLRISDLGPCGISIPEHLSTLQIDQVHYAP